MKEAEFYVREDNHKVRCLLCPRKCLIENGRAGACFIRKNVNGSLRAESYSMAAAVNTDPIEKKPLFHYYPGSKVFSVGASGCNMTCGFCQNHEISRNKGREIPLSPDEIVSLALEKGCVGVACTYSEPLAWYEFSLETAEKAKLAGLKSILVSNGFINPEPFKKLLPFIDAANIDLKTFSARRYKEIGGELETVKNTIKTLLQAGIPTEISSLAAPGMWDEDSFGEMCAWLGETETYIPLHINAYFPAYRYSEPPTSVRTLINYKNIADKYLKYVYIGNARIEGASDTRCHKCGETLIKRSGYRTEIFISEPECPKCKTNLPLVL